MKILPIIVLLIAFAASTAVPAQPDQADIKRVQGLIETGELDEALKVAEVYIADNPQDPRMRFLKGLILTNRSDWEEAIKVFRTLSNDFPDLPAPLNNLAVVYAETGNYDLAQEALKQALSINPEYASAHENLGDIYVTLATLSYRQATSHEQSQQTAQAKLKVLGQLIPDLADASTPVQTISKTTPQTAPTASQPVIDPTNSKEVESFVKAWASAWSSQDVDNYLGFYGDDFQPAEGKSLSRWRSERRYRLAYPAYIRIGIEDVNTRMLTENQAEATFTQRYESNTFRDTALKQLLLERQGNQWKIVQERVRPE